MRTKWHVLLSAVVFSLCIVPTIVSYSSYSFSWDDSDYLTRSIAVNKAFWSGDRPGLRKELHNNFRPPAMTLLGLPWGRFAPEDAAGKCFVTLAVCTSFFAACCLFLLLRIGLEPLYLITASVCAFASLGPYPAGAHAHYVATGFMADSLFAWNAFAATLLIPYEAIPSASSTFDDLARGVLWGTILSAMALTRVNGFYFIGTIALLVFVIRMRRNGHRSAFVALASLGACSIPAIFYWLRYGLPSLRNGWAASFGHDAPFYYLPLSRFLEITLRQSPGMLLGGLFALVGIVVFAARRRNVPEYANILAFLVMAGYSAITLASHNREIRFLFPAIIGMPFLIGLLVSGKTFALPKRSALIASTLAVCILLAACGPLLHRPYRQSLHKGEEILAEARASNAKRVLLATASSSLNVELVGLAIAVSPSQPSVTLDSLALRAAAGGPIEDDFRTIRDSDLVVFQDKSALDAEPPNDRIPEYEDFARGSAGTFQLKVVDDMHVYELRNGHH